jgi:anti-sigma factor RsiW
MKNGDHLTNYQLQEFISGRIDAAESEQILTHLEQCEHCLVRIDALWSQQPVASAMVELAELDAPTAQRLERQLVSKIHRSNLSATVLRLGTRGFFSVAVSLLRPFMRSRKSEATLRRGTTSGTMSGTRSEP